jgi:hypothetical protein
VEGIEYLGTSLAHDYRQAGPQGNLRIGPTGAPSVHGAVIAFADWLHEQVVDLHRAADRSASETLQAVVVRSAWARALEHMSVAEHDPDLWNWVRQELDSEYSRLSPLPPPNASVVAAAREREGAESTPPFTPIKKGEAARLLGLRRADSLSKLLAEVKSGKFPAWARGHEEEVRELLRENRVGHLERDRILKLVPLKERLMPKRR